MQIYLFTICSNDEITIVQIYSLKGWRKAKQCIIDIHGCKESEIHYMHQDETTAPLNWGNYINI